MLKANVKSTTPVTIAISDLRGQPQFRDAVADRVWRAWWREQGTPLETIASWVDDSLSESVLPLALVAHDGPVFAGTASVIESDLPDRPHYWPWVAAVWVEPQFRIQRIGHALVERAAATAFALGVETVYLCAREHLHGFYTRQGWTLIERDVGPRRLGVFTLAAPRPGVDLDIRTA